MTAPARILIVEDQFFFRLALRSIIDTRSDMAIAGEIDDASKALAAHRQLQPDVTIMDLRLPGGSGFDLIAEICKIDPKARIVVLSNYEGSEDVHRALEAGALAYLTNDAGGEEL